MKPTPETAAIFILERGLAASKRNRLRERLLAHGLQVRYVDGGQHAYFEVSGDDLAIRTLSPNTWPGVVRLIELAPPYPCAARRDDGAETSTTVDLAFGVTIGAQALTIIAGPCSLETPERAIDIARHIKQRGATAFRAGCFKPRSSPYAFQGLGLDGLALLREVRGEFELPIVTEVLSTDHLDAVLEVADVLQVGSRNMHNASLLKALGRVRKPVLLKRGFAATVDEFLLAAEFVLTAGNGDIILCERGIRSAAGVDGVVLDIGAVAELQYRSHLPVIVDPSHGAARARRVPALARAAIAAGASGLLVEVHPAADQALSDGQQALDYEQFEATVQQVAAIHTALRTDR